MACRYSVQYLKRSGTRTHTVILNLSGVRKACSSNHPPPARTFGLNSLVRPWTPARYR
jgi:hypothetical protein